jgi:Ca2+-binding RTX toxin-like protein
VAALGAAGVAATVVLPPAGAAAESPCRYNAENGYMVVQLGLPAPTIARGGTGTSPDDPVVVDGVPCGAATVSTVERILVEAYWDRVTVSLAGGPLAPGRTDEPGGSDEIEIAPSPISRAPISLDVRGTLGPDRIVAGLAGVNFNPDEADGIDADAVGPWKRQRHDSWAAPDAERGVIYGGGGADSLSSGGGAGTGGPHPYVVLDGEAGYDALTGGGLADVLRGGRGNDRLDGGDGHDDLDGGAGADTMDGAADGDAFRAGPGEDAMHGGGEGAVHFSDAVYYSDAPAGAVVDLAAGVSEEDGYGGRDTLSGIESLSGSRGDDRFYGDEHTNSFFGYHGADVLESRGGVDEAIGGDGEDVIRTGADGDYGYGGNGADVIEGGEGGDRLDGHQGHDAVDGGPGFDIAEVNGGRRVIVDLRTGLISFPGTPDSEHVTGFEGASTYAHGSRLIGDGGDNVLEARAQNTVVNGLGGDDRLLAETYTYESAPRAIVVSGNRVEDGRGGLDELPDWPGEYGAAASTIRATQFGDDIRGWGGVLGLGGDDVIVGYDAEMSGDNIDGGAGDDSIYGRRGFDELIGGTGSDYVEGGLERDEIEVLDGEADTVRCVDGSTDYIEADRAMDTLDGCG